MEEWMRWGWGESVLYKESCKLRVHAACAFYISACSGCVHWHVFILHSGGVSAWLSVHESQVTVCVCVCVWNVWERRGLAAKWLMRHRGCCVKDSLIWKDLSWKKGRKRQRRRKRWRRRRKRKRRGDTLELKINKCSLNLKDIVFLIIIIIFLQWAKISYTISIFSSSIIFAGNKWRTFGHFTPFIVFFFNCSNFQSI